MRIETGLKLDFKDVLIRPKRSKLLSRSEVSLERSYVMKHSERSWTGIPLMVANMDSVGTFEMALSLSSQKIMTAIHKHYALEEWQKFYHEMGGKDIMEYVMPTSGISEDDLEKLDAILAITGATGFCIDVANGYSQGFVEKLRGLREKYGDKTIVAGNVVTGEMTEELIMSGADVVKVGIGPGSVCTTRLQTGVGYPQLSAVIECADAAHGLGGLIVADGGCTCSGDIAKAFGGGADFVMLGGMLAGHDETSGVVVQEGGVSYKVFYGMSSDTAMLRYSGRVAAYRAAEGKTVKVRCRGPVEFTALEILGGLRSSCTYIGASSLKEMSKRTTFIRVMQQANPTFAGAETANPYKDRVTTTASCGDSSAGNSPASP